MTYTITFVNFTLGAPFQKNLGRWPMHLASSFLNPPTELTAEC